MAGRAGAKGQNSNILTQYLSCFTWDRAEILRIDKFVKEKKIIKKISAGRATGRAADINCKKGRHWQILNSKGTLEDKVQVRIGKEIEDSKGFES